MTNTQTRYNVRDTNLANCTYPQCPYENKKPCNRNSQVLTHCEIDALLSALNVDDLSGRWKTIGDFEKFLCDRNKLPEKHYGLFEKDIAVCKFFEDRKGETILADIIAKNEASGMGNVQIPNTNIKLINYSYCPQCGETYSQKDLSLYYANPIIRPERTLRETLRKETRVVCKHCQTSFLPTLIIVDGSPKSAMQYLCRNQVIDAIEVYMDERYHVPVLTQKRDNYQIRPDDGFEACLNDLDIHKLEKAPTLISNFLQYTPPPLMLSFIDGTNVAAGDVVFGRWQEKATPEQRHARALVY